MTNIVEILRFAPQGLKLYSLVHGEVTFKEVDTTQEYYPIYTTDKQNDISDAFTKDGKIYYDYDDAECVLFPSKEHLSWDGWQEILFQKGDFIICEVVNISENQQNVCCIYNGFNEHYNDYAGYFLCHEGRTAENLNKQILLKNARYATPEEREQFFKELNDNGYYWNENTKQMEKSLQQDKHKNCLGCIATETKKEPFTIDDFKPFDKVLVKYDFDTKWTIELFEQYDKSQKDTGEYICLASSSNYCIPYNDETKHLLGTTEDAPIKYKTW